MASPTLLHQSYTVTAEGELEYYIPVGERCRKVYVTFTVDVLTVVNPRIRARLYSSDLYPGDQNFGDSGDWGSKGLITFEVDYPPPDLRMNVRLAGTVTTCTYWINSWVIYDD